MPPAEIFPPVASERLPDGFEGRFLRASPLGVGLDGVAGFALGAGRLGAGFALGAGRLGAGFALGAGRLGALGREPPPERAPPPPGRACTTC